MTSKLSALAARLEDEDSPFFRDCITCKEAAAALREAEQVLRECSDFLPTTNEDSLQWEIDLGKRIAELLREGG